ncbi:protein LAX PANICLE 2 [Mangifera indica]|uniref:protein LAX PANICLE 2 n=1 Tax=Mangifera indica TaxID=29780 RepID=UPI001CFB75DB|nr:protein LAX PANICLE 2 [Mangifera indica]
MTMVPAENLSKQQNHHLYSGYGGCGNSCTESFGLMSRIKGYDYSSEACLGSDLVVNPMAEDESRTDSLNEAGSSSKENQEDQRDEGWLQLSIGSHHKTNHDIKHHQVDPTVRRGGLIELDLLPGGGGSSPQTRPVAPTFHVPEFRGPRPVMNIAGANSFSSSLFFQHQGSSSAFLPHQEINWAFRPIPQNIAMASSSSNSSSSLMPFGSYFARPFQVHTGIDVAGPSSDFRVIDPPRRPQSGIWFMLLASQNQAREPFLPQIKKSYLRIKDERMTVRVLLKYLVNKLKLDSESEIEITCRGQQLSPFLTLQHVRDNIWSPRDAVTLLPDSSTTDHVMVLHYARTA